MRAQEASADAPRNLYVCLAALLLAGLLLPGAALLALLSARACPASATPAPHYRSHRYLRYYSILSMEYLASTDIIMNDFFYNVPMEQTWPT